MQRARVIAVTAAVACLLGLGTLPAARAAVPVGHFSAHHVCGTPGAGRATCLAIEVQGSRHLSAATGPPGYHPADLVAAYELDNGDPTRGTGQTIAIVDAYDDPNAEADLAVYRSTFGLAACTTANGCFRKVNQTGGTTYPPFNAGWAGEISLDLDMASAICPNCTLLLVEARTNSDANLAKSVDEAVALGATVVSNSYGTVEYARAMRLAPHYDHPGIPITVASGDGGFAAGPWVPAVFGTVTAVGGTTLEPATNARGWHERIWSGGVSGCSAFVAKPAWQHDTDCAGRTIADVSAVGDPGTGVAVYFSVAGTCCWRVYGGTSVSAPIIAGVFALAGNGAEIDDASRLYAQTSRLHDITRGKNGNCRASSLCRGKVGYDAPSGLGTPRGTRAF